MSSKPESSRAASNTVNLTLDQQLRAASREISALTKANADLKSSNTRWLEHSSDMKDRLLNARKHNTLLQEHNRALQTKLNEARIAADASEQLYKEHNDSLRREMESNPGAVKKVRVTYEMVVVRENDN